MKKLLLLGLFGLQPLALLSAAEQPVDSRTTRFFSFAAQAKRRVVDTASAVYAHPVSQYAVGTVSSVCSRVKQNPATYAAVGAHVAAGVCFNSLCNQINFKPVTIGLGMMAAGAYYSTLGCSFVDSFMLGRKLDDAAKERMQPKRLNTTDWTQKNSIEINETIYRSGYQLWKGYNEQPNMEGKRNFSRQLLNAVMVDSAEGARSKINESLQLIQQELRQSSDHTHERYSNAGLLLGRHVYTVSNQGAGFPSEMPVALENWLFEADNESLFKKEFGSTGCYFEQLLDDKDFLSKLHVLESDFFARLFSVTEYRTKVLGQRLSWYECSSWSRNGAALYYVALLKQYFFLLSCKAIFQRMMADGVVSSNVQAGTW